MALPAKKLSDRQLFDEPIRLLTETPSETESGNKFIDSLSNTIAQEYGVEAGSNTIIKVVRTRVKVATDELKKEFSRNNEGDVKLDDEENINKVRTTVKADLHHLLISE